MSSGISPPPITAVWVEPQSDDAKQQHAALAEQGAFADQPPYGVQVSPGRTAGPVPGT